ncbi:PAS domain-containing protein, partial [Nostoc sp. CCY0012]
GRVAWDGLVVDVTDLKNHEIRLEESQKIARLGNWNYDVATGQIKWSKQLFRLFGRDPAQAEPTYLENLQLYHPEDAAKLHQAVEQALATGES